MLHEVNGWEVIQGVGIYITVLIDKLLHSIRINQSQITARTAVLGWMMQNDQNLRLQ